MSLLDYLVIAVYAIAALALGVRSARGHSTSRDFFVAGRNLPTWAVLGSMLATELSAATFIGVPHAAFLGDWGYLQLAFGAMLAKLVVGLWVIPVYHELQILTVYGFLAERFGSSARRAAAACFAAGRVLASGVRLYIAALAFTAVTGSSIELAIAVCGALAGAYTLVGGIRSVVWTDTLQAGVFLLGAGALVAALAGQVEGGIPAILTWGEENGRTRIFHFAPFFSLRSATPFGVGLIGGFFLTLATHSTDQDMVQRLLTTRDGRSGGRALMWSALLNFPLTLLFLFIGSGLALFYAVPPAYEIADTNRILPLFALHELPSGLRGLVFAGLFAAAMSSLDSAICAIATTWVVDIAPRKTPTSDRALLRQTRVSSAVVCALLIGAAMAAAAYQRSLGSDAGLSLVELALSSMTILYGGLLGLFGVGLFWRSRGSERSAIAGLGTGGALGLLLFVHPLLLGEVVIAWPWWIPIAATVSAAVVATGRAPAVDMASEPSSR